MNEANNPPPPPPNGNDEVSLKIIWLLVAFIPSLIGIACLQIKNSDQWLVLILVVINVLFSMVAGAQLVRGIRNGLTQSIAGLFLVLFFFILNALIVVFVGCSGMGRISP
jgi:hypothetical protein